MRSALRTAAMVIGLFLGMADSPRAQEIDSETGLPGDETVVSSNGSGSDRDALQFGGPFGGDYLPRLGARFHTPDGIGYVDSFLSFEGFVPLLQVSGRSLTFADMRVLLAEDRVGANLGLGHRLYSQMLGRTFGGYVFWDNRNTGDRTVSQISGGFDTLGDSLDARANFYVPLDTNRQLISTPLTNSFFVGNQLVANRRLVHQTALRGFDAEVGALLVDRFDLWGFVGPYFFTGEGAGNGWGGRGRLELRIADKTTLQLAVQNDRHFDTTVVFGAAIRLPGYAPRQSRGYNLAEDRLANPVERLQNIVVKETVDNDVTVALDPITGNPLFVRHVGVSATDGEGTFEDPFASLEAALATTGENDIIYVQPNEAGYLGAFVLKPGQLLLGSGNGYLIPTAGGAVEVAAMTAERPILTNPVGDVVRLADDSVIAGFDVRATDGSAIVGSGIDGFTIRDNRITGAGRGIDLINATGLGLIDANEIIAPTLEAIRIENFDTPLGVTILRNTIEGANSGSTAAGAVVLRSGGPSSVAFDAAVIANRFTNNLGAGVHAEAIESSVLNVSIAQNEFRGQTGAGARLGAKDSATLNSDLGSNVFDGNARAIDLESNGAADALLATNVHDNTVTNQTETAILLAGRGAGRLEAVIAVNTIEANLADGIAIETSEDAILSAQFSDMTVQNNADGLSVSSTGSSASRTTVAIATSRFEGNRGSGIVIDSAGDALVTLGIQESSASFNEASGLRLVSRQSGFLGTEITGGVFSSNGAEGVSLLASDAERSASLLSVSDSTFEQNQRDGLSIVAEDETRFDLLMVNNLFQGGEGFGLKVTSLDDSTVVADILQNEFRANRLGGIRLNADGEGIDHEMLASVQRNLIADTPVAGFVARTSNDGKLLLDLIDNESNRFLLRNDGTIESILMYTSLGSIGTLDAEGEVTNATQGASPP